MSILEYNEEEEIKKIRASERRGGYDDGWNAGRIEGEAVGKKAGRIEGKKEALLEILEEKGAVTESLKKKIQNQNDMTILKSWIQRACTIDSVAKFENDISGFVK